MLILPIDEARAGMRLAAPVFHPENPNQILLRQGYALDSTVIPRMRSMGISVVYVDYPGLDDLDRHLAVHLSPARQAVYQKIKQSVTQVQRQTRACLPYNDYCSTTRDLIDTLLTQGQNPIYLDQMSRQGGDSVAHAAAVGHLSLLLGLKLENYLISQRSRLPPNRAKDVVNLGVAGMLHDLGMSRLPESLQRCSEIDPPTDPGQLAEWQTHVRIGYDLIRNDVESTAAAAVYQHHQHFDGSGFPVIASSDGARATMDGQRIHIFARIILCANLYDRFASLSGPQGRATNYQTLKVLEARCGDWLDPEVFRMLQAVAPPFPPGCRVRLSDNSSAIVVDINPATPLRPIVRRLAADEWELAGESIDLRVEGTPQIQLPVGLERATAAA